MFPHDHARVDVGLGSDEQFAPLLEGVEGIAGGDAGLRRDERAIGARGDFPAPGRILAEQVADHGSTTGEVGEVAFEADEAPGGDGGLKGGHLAAVFEVGHLALPRHQGLDGVAYPVVGNLDPEVLERLEGLAVLLAGDDLRPADEHLIPFPAHGFRDHRDLEFAARAHQEYVAAGGIAYLERDVGAGFANQSFAQVPGGQELAVPAGERAVVHAEVHLDGGGVDLGKCNRFAPGVVAKGLADERLLDPGEPDDVSRGGRVRFFARQAGKGIHLGNLAGGRRFAVPVQAGDHVTHRHRPAFNLSNGDSAHVVAPVQVADEHAERAVRIGLGRRDVAAHRFEEGAKSRGEVMGPDGHESVPGAAV